MQQYNVVNALSKFNDRYTGKELKSCYYLDNKEIVLTTQSSHICCCNSGKAGLGYPQITDSVDTTVAMGKEAYVAGWIDIMELNQTGEGSCADCKHLKNTLYKPVEYDAFKIGRLNISTFYKCNLSCVYCFLEEGIKSYDPVVVCNRFMDEDLVDGNTVIAHAYGEPTVHNEFKDILKYAIKLKAFNEIYTNALLCKDEILQGLAKNYISLIISVDSGTPETYQRVKGLDAYDIVWNSIKKYSEVSGNITLKYILFSYNSSKKDIDGFLSKCVECGIKNVILSGEQYVNIIGTKDVGWEFGDAELEAGKYMITECDRFDINCVVYDSVFKQADYIELMRYSITTLENHSVNKTIARIEILEKEYGKGNAGICIFGSGVWGGRILDFLEDIGYEAKYYCDNDKEKQDTVVNGIPCVPVETVSALNNILILIPERAAYAKSAIEQLNALVCSKFITVL